ncbi:universal stress protein [Pseudonocardia halophobica]|uniref:Universal stress protein n=1 Tax=Pseudonocardia halophobica TaxID=29401 RepID=A0A9W6L0T0_9PSEU|nr:universal stress protein [Pseudonocardia halophobica]GLL10710.1 universal stress protein [Pseudonocardia halophobica]
MTNQLGGAVVAGVDGSDSALDATRWAAADAARRGTRLRLVAAVGWTTFQPAGLPALGQEYQRQVTARAAEEHLEAAVAAAREVAPGVEIEREVRGGEAPVVLRTESERAALVVVGTRGRGGFSGLLLGSVAVAVATHAECPVVVVRGTSAPDGPIVVGVDGSDGGGENEAALGVAFEEASRRSVPLVAVHAWSEAVLDPFLVPLLDRTVVQAEQEKALEGRLAGWTAKYTGVDVRAVIVVDGAARELVDRSTGAALVVVGSRGRGTVAGALLGSVSQAVLHHAASPVAVVRPEAGTPA